MGGPHRDHVEANSAAAIAINADLVQDDVELTFAGRM